MAPRLPYAAIGIGIAVILGVWAFLVADAAKERAVIAGIPALVFLAGAMFPSFTGRAISLISWILYGLGCIVYLRYNGIGIR